MEDLSQSPLTKLQSPIRIILRHVLDQFAICMDDIIWLLQPSALAYLLPGILFSGVFTIALVAITIIDVPSLVAVLGRLDLAWCSMLPIVLKLVLRGIMYGSR